MNTSTHTNTTTNAARATGFGFLRRGMAATLLATAITATAVGLSATAHADAGIPTPAHTQRTDGPDSIPNNGVHMHFLVNGSATSVLDAYKTELEGQGWAVTVESSGGYGGAGGATYTAARGDTYGVFSGGGSGSTTDVNACAWPSKPSNPNCGGGNRH